MAMLIDGKAIAAGIEAQVTEGLAALRSTCGVVTGLAVVLVGEDPASEVYVRRKLRQTAKVDMRSFEHRLSSRLARPNCWS